ncbi:hypothetical protein G6F70_006985 [Rhizopus microsporus]|nr:hypothetical protein G6F71_005975 [Rhizopus microsporus]KAG1197003.1 hypothetical protein G6F70_006985 [Rhizopus microsporus]KAG1210338.1 hypothetical protein G6F69_005572 [Rhizopus microsporus]KAG1232043.1 hypothetical protein G6F67_005311 [Rhizopus microsporus]KAG1269486.1 hypothetical protein G6F68_000207 [Rhizopus microsporus]
MLSRNSLWAKRLQTRPTFPTVSLLVSRILKQNTSRSCFPLKDNPIKGYSDALSAACIVLATAYLNHIDKPKGLLYKLADDFCWQILINGESKWPIQYFDHASSQNIAQILPICNGLQVRLSTPPTAKNLAASPTKFVPALAVIISELEKLCNEHKDDNTKMPRRFSLMPTPSMHWQYISINAKALQAITKHKSDGTYEGNVNLFYSTFNFKKFGYESLDKVLESQNKFTCCIQTGGFGACFVFSRKAKEEKATAQLGLEDFSDQEIQEHFQPCAVDPGRTHTGFSLAKTVDMEKTNAYVTYALINVPRLFRFYDERSAPFRFYDYQGRQRSSAEEKERIARKSTVAVRGHVSGVTGILLAEGVPSEIKAVQECPGGHK